MANPITWRNIEAPDFRGAIAGLNATSNTFETARKLLTDTLRETERIDQANWDNTKTNNTNAVLNRLMEFQTPEELAQARAAGELQSLLGQYGAQIDAARVREAIDNRGDVLQRRAIDTLDYQNRLRTEDEARVAREQKPILDRLMGLVEQGETNSATQAARIYADSGMLGEDRLRTILENARKRTEGIEDRDLQRRNTQSIIAARDAQAAAEKARQRAETERLKVLEQQYKLASNADAANEKTVQDYLKNTVIGLGTLENSDGRQALEKVISDFKLSDNAAQDVRQNLEKYFPGGYYTRTVNGKTERIPVPVQLVQQALSATDEFGDGSWWSRRGDKVRDYIAATLEDPNVLQMITEGVTIRDRRRALRTQYALNPDAQRLGATRDTGLLLQLGDWMNPRQ